MLLAVLHRGGEVEEGLPRGGRGGVGRGGRDGAAVHAADGDLDEVAGAGAVVELVGGAVVADPVGGVGALERKRAEISLLKSEFVDCRNSNLIRNPSRKNLTFANIIRLRWLIQTKLFLLSMRMRRRLRGKYSETFKNSIFIVKVENSKLRT